MEILSEIIQTTLNSFDFAYCIVVNILTYLIIRLIDDKRKQHLTTWQKRVVLLITLSSTGVLYIIFGTDPENTYYKQRYDDMQTWREHAGKIAKQYSNNN